MDTIIYVSEDIALDFSMKNNFSPTVTVEELVETMKAHGYKVILSFVHPAVGRIVKMERDMQLLQLNHNDITLGLKIKFNRKN